MQYIEKLTRRGILPIQSIIKNNVVAAGKQKPRDAQVTRFLEQNKDYLTLKQSNDIDCNCYYANTKASYRDYFKLL